MSQRDGKAAMLLVCMMAVLGSLIATIYWMIN